MYKLTEYEPALRSYSKALEMDPGCIDAWNGQIGCLIALDELHEADMWTKKAAEIVGESQDLLALQARICCRRGDIDRAYGLSDAAMQAPGNSALVWVVRGEIMLYSKNKQPEHCFDKAVAAERDYTVNMDIAGACMYAGRFTTAFKYLKPALDDYPELAPLWKMAADCYRLMGNRKKALECLATVIEIDPAYPGIRDTYEEVKNEGGIKNFLRNIFKRW
jgi:tetratricopeptide (TPR) repeat protein